MKEEMEYSTRDFQIASCLLSAGHDLLRLEKADETTFYFVFSISPDLAEKLVQDYWSNKLTFPAKKLNDSIHQLKTRLHGGY